MSEDNHGTYTAEVEYSAPDGDSKTLYRTEENSTARLTADYAVSQVPSDATIFRVGVWSGTIQERPDSGHESGLLEE